MGLGKIKLKFKEDFDPQDVLLDSFAQKREEELGISQKKFETPLLKKVLSGPFLFAFFMFLLFFLKTFQMQIINGEDYLARAQDNKFTNRQMSAERGVIYSSDFTQLVSNKASFDLVCYKKHLPEDEGELKRVLGEIAQIAEKLTEELMDKINEEERDEFALLENINHEKLLILSTKIKDLTGFEIANNTIREYEDGFIFSHIIGYKRQVGESTNLEKEYNDALIEDPGEILIERDALGNVMSKELVSYASSGNNLVLWLDADLQKKIYETLIPIKDRVGAKGAVGIALDPKTGGVLAMVSLPSYDNNMFAKGLSQEDWDRLNSDKSNPLFNRAISGTYLTGSVVKPIESIGILEENLISANQNLYCEGSITIPNIYNPEASTIKKDNNVHGYTDMRKAIAESCNVYFYTLGGGYKDQKGLGPTKIKEYLELFGWGQKTGIDLPNEAEGFIPTKEWKKDALKENWYDGDTYNMSIGQGYFQITPLEVITSYLPIVNGGKLLKPQIVKEIISGDSQNYEVIKEFEPQVIREDMADPYYYQIVREGMRQGVTGYNSPLASSVTLNSLPVAVAAKTGTAELGAGRYNNWISVFGPYNDPEILLLVMFEGVDGVQGATLPAAKEILGWYFDPNKNIKQVVSEVLGENVVAEEITEQ